MSSKSGQFRIPGKAKKLGLDSFVRSVTTVFMHGTIVDKEAFPRHPVSEASTITSGFHSSSRRRTSSMAVNDLRRWSLGLCRASNMGSVWGKRTPPRKVLGFAGRRFVNGLRFNATKFALTPLREVGQSPFSIKGPLDVHGKDSDHRCVFARRWQRRILRHQGHGIDAIVFLPNGPTVLLPANVPGKTDDLDIDDHRGL